MKYTAKPIIVTAYKISIVGDPHSADRKAFDYVTDRVAMPLRLENGDVVWADDAMLARITPMAGDYWVIQDDGYTYLNPKDVFERKYEPAFDFAALQELRKASA